MFELLLIIYLLPVLIIGMLLLKLVFWLLKIAIRLAVWLVKKAFILIWKLIVLVFAILIGCDVMPRESTGQIERNRTNMRNGTVLKQMG
ncbi:hypothetical protein NXW30_18900 [Phocaeicola vulgatus]|nr:hypothetical protein [Phocaeicola vulgatus]